MEAPFESDHVDAYNTDGLTRLHLASMRNQIDIVCDLLNRGADVDLPGKETGTTALMFAAQAGYSEIVEILIKHGADVNHQDNKGWTALMTSSKNGYIDTVGLLLKNGAGVGFFNENYDTAILLAERFSQAEIVAKLKEAHDKNESTISPVIAAFEQKIKAIEKKINFPYLDDDGVYE